MDRSVNVSPDAILDTGVFGDLIGQLVPGALIALSQPRLTDLTCPRHNFIRIHFRHFWSVTTSLWLLVELLGASVGHLNPYWRYSLALYCTRDFSSLQNVLLLWPKP